MAMFVNGSGQNEHSLQRTCHRCCLFSFGSFGQAVSEEKIKLANQKEELPMVAIFVNGSGQMSNLQRGPSIDPSYQVSLHLAGFQRRRLKCEKLTDDRRMPSDGKSSQCLWQGELKSKNCSLLCQNSNSYITMPSIFLFIKKNPIKIR